MHPVSTSRVRLEFLWSATGMWRFLFWQIGTSVSEKPSASSIRLTFNSIITLKLLIPYNIMRFLQLKTNNLHI